MNKNRDVPKHCLKVIYSCRGGRVICSIARHCSAHWLAVGYRAKCVSVPPSMKCTWKVTGNLEDFLHISKIRWDLLQKLLQMDKIMFYLSLTPLGGEGCVEILKRRREQIYRDVQISIWSWTWYTYLWFLKSLTCEFENYLGNLCCL